MFFVLLGFSLREPLVLILLAILFVLYQILSYYLLSVSYKKEKYTFFANKIVRNSGTIISESETELIIRNVTHVTMKLPYVENKLMKTGKIKIESAGSAKSEITLSSIGSTEKIYDYVQRLMQRQGFKLTKTRLIQEARPSTIAVILQILTPFLFVFLIPILWILVILLSPILGPLFLLKFLDLKKRVYRVYEDVITYSEGFLSKNYSFIPIENLAECELNQTFVDKMFGLYDIRLSCQGIGNEIHFKNMSEGAQLEKNIDELINSSRPLMGTEKTSFAKQKAKARFKSEPLHELAPDTAFTAEFSMDAARTILPLIPLIPIGIVLALVLRSFGFVVLISLVIVPFASAMISINTRRFLVKARSVESRENFLSQRNHEFSNEKIAGIIFRESFIDKWFRTCSIVFWSLGSSRNIVFSNIKKTQGLFEKITAKKGMTSKEVVYRMDSKFSFVEMLKANFFIIIFLVFLSFVALVLLAFREILMELMGITPVWINTIILILALCSWVMLFGGAVYRNFYYRKSKIEFNKDHIYFQKGLLLKEKFYVSYKDVKGIKTVKYPFSKRGSIGFDIAGESVIVTKDSRGRKSTQTVSNRFKISYVENIDLKNDLLDQFFYRKLDARKAAWIENNISSYVEKPVITSKPDVTNSVIELFFLLPFLPIIIPVIKAISYSIQPHRVIEKSGIFYKNQLSVLFTKVDHINLSQGALNKSFKTGSISINTTGSSKPEMVIKNVKDFREFYDVLKKHY